MYTEVQVVKVKDQNVAHSADKGVGGSLRTDGFTFTPTSLMHSTIYVLRHTLRTVYPHDLCDTDTDNSAVKSLNPMQGFVHSLYSGLNLGQTS